MIDASSDQDYAAFERSRERDAARREERPPRQPRGTLADLPPCPPGVASGVLQACDGQPAAAAGAASAAVAVPPDGRGEPDDPLESLRVARLGFAAAVALAVIAIWIGRRRN